MKKRVLQLIGSFHQGGSEQQAVALSRMLKEEGSFDVHVATLNKQGVLLPQLDGLGLLEIPEFPLTSFFNANFVKQVRRCAGYLREEKIELVHTHDFYTNVFGMAAATLAAVRARVASKRETSEMRSAAQQFIENLAFDRASAVVVNSRAVKACLEDHLVPAEKLHVIYNGTDVGRFNGEPDRHAVLAELGLPFDQDIRFVTMVANLRHPVKNIPMLLRAARQVVDRMPRVHFVIAGEGELQAELEAEAERLKVAESVHFIGRCDKIPSLLAISYACVLTSKAEGFSNSILEYMAAGKPVVTTNVGGAGEAVVEGETGYLVASDDDEAMAANLIELLADEQKAARFGAGGRSVAAERFSSDAQLAATMALYRSLLEKT